MISVKRIAINVVLIGTLLFIVRISISSIQEYFFLKQLIEAMGKPNTIQVHLANGKVLNLSADYTTANLPRILDVIAKIKKQEEGKNVVSKTRSIQSKAQK